ncbi:hypothetical protein [Kaistella carnis]|uniref:Uncharacterized protein n=1 Tax=Kaistella carnis TaxID=1241979 RepID=A0A3G8XDU0_9FLAO|nr:hypothetical protein [Kaistella carnis]AZI31705.1 hypothetical protein EIB73_00300 [Kaistella carnis]
MDLLNLKNKVLLLSAILLLNCAPGKESKYVLLNDFPPIVIINGDESDIKESNIYLLRDNDTIDKGHFKVYSKSDNKIDLKIGLDRRDSLQVEDKILFQMKGKQFTVSDFQKLEVRSSGNPYIISYKINGTAFIDREGNIKL